MEENVSHFKILGFEYTRVGEITVIIFCGIHVFTKIGDIGNFFGFRFGD